MSRASQASSSGWLGGFSECIWSSGITSPRPKKRCQRRLTIDRAKNSLASAPARPRPASPGALNGRAAARPSCSSWLRRAAASPSSSSLVGSFPSRLDQSRRSGTSPGAPLLLPLVGLELDHAEVAARPAKSPFSEGAAEERLHAEEVVLLPVVDQRVVVALGAADVHAEEERADVAGQAVEVLDPRLEELQRAGFCTGYPRSPASARGTAGPRADCSGPLRAGNSASSRRSARAA